MKKMKLYILLLLVPLLLMGCIEKGKPASGISVDVSGTGGYTWEQLYYMADVGANTNLFSIEKNINEDINTLLSKYEVGSVKQKIVSNHAKLLSTVIEEIEDKTINVTSTLSSVRNSNLSAITNLELFSKSKIVTISQLIENNLLSPNITEYNKLTDDQKKELSYLPKFLNLIVARLNDIETNNKSLKENYNIFYSDLYDLYKATTRIQANKDMLLSVLNISVSSIDESSIINEKIAQLNKEKGRLSSSIIKTVMTTTDISYLSNAYTNLLNTYNEYNPLTPYLISDSELTFRGRDETIIATGGYNNIGINTYETKLDQIYLYIGKTFSSNSVRDASIKAYLNEFAEIKSAYTIKNYRICISKAVNVSYIYATLKAAYSEDIYDATGIEM